MRLLVMAGMPKRRSRQLHSLPDQSRFPSGDWHRMSDTEKIIGCLGRNLDNIRDLVSVPWTEADFHTRNLQLQVFAIGVKLGLKLHTDRTRDEGRQEMLNRLAEIFNPDTGSAADMRAGAASVGETDTIASPASPNHANRQ